MASNSSHFLTDFFNDKFVKLLLKILLVLIVIYALYALGGAIFNYKVKFLSKEENKVASADTVKIIQPIVQHDTIRIADIQSKQSTVSSKKNDKKEIPSITQQN